MQYILYAWDFHLDYYDVFRTNTLWGFLRQCSIHPDKQVTASYFIVPRSPFPWIE